MCVATLSVLAQLTIFNIINKKGKNNGDSSEEASGIPLSDY
jgi:hypothetical protein